ncbi:hypothetical protein OJ253_2463 [Cryptosporidium canis]|uniref:Protein kinase domain-containing protein n=1 Tax=Cryptosporidium canis TaxID=195482 RepID=A0A9D5DF61_9CRYT|nr:hypothetical protein OJ253_2463 [Cryptosporidium canis]
MKVKSSDLFEKVVILSDVVSKKASRVCVAEGYVSTDGSIRTVLLKMYRKDMVVNHEHIWNERRVLEYLRDSKTLTDQERLSFPLMCLKQHFHTLSILNPMPLISLLFLIRYDSLVLEESDTGISYITIALQHIQGFALNEYLNRGDVTLTMLRRILVQVAQGIGYLHRECIIHRDIKCSNIIVESETGRAVIIDMSLACFIENKERRLSELCGSFHSMAPEMICMEKPNYGLGLDWWSFGVIMYELIFG